MPDAPETVDQLVEILHTMGIAGAVRRYKRPPLSSNLLRDLFAIDDTVGNSFLACYPLAPSDLLIDLAKRESANVDQLARIAANPRVPPPALQTMVEHESETVRCGAASSNQLSPRQIDSLVDDPSESVCLILAEHPNLKPRHMARLATHDNPSIRTRLCRHKRLDPEIAVALTADPSAVVRFTVVSQAQADEELLLFWADSDLPEIQAALMNREELPTSVWHSLLLSPNESIRQQAASHCELDEPLLIHFSKLGNHAAIRDALATQPLSDSTVEWLLEHATVDDLRHLARNPHLSPPAATRLLEFDPHLATALLDNPEYAISVATHLVCSRDDKVLARLASGGFLHPEDYGQLTDEGPFGRLVAHAAIRGQSITPMRDDLAFRLLEHNLPSLRRLAIRSYAFPQATLLRVLNEDPAPANRELARQRIAEIHNSPQPSSATFVRERQDLETLLQAIDQWTDPETFPLREDHSSS